jgi:adenosylcobinamide-GDP ribazoletransferase
MNILKRIIAAFSFLTIAPIPRGITLDAGAIGRSRAFFALPGLALGAAYAALAWLAARHTALPPAFTTLIITTAMCALTRCLHVDGLADLTDAWGSAAPRERALEIMRDSRIGTFGVAAIALLLGAKAVAVFQLCSIYNESNPVRVLYALALAPVIGRFTAAWLIQWFPYARPEGKGSYFLEQKPLGDLLIAALLTASAAWLLAGARGLILLAAATLAAHIFGLYWNRKYNGLTGDIYGAAIELTETAALLAVALW